MRGIPAGLALALALSAAACASSTSRDAAGPAPMARADSTADRTENAGGIEVQVDNQSINDVSVYLLKAGSRWLVGQAGGLRTTTLRIPGSVTPVDLRVRLLADPIGGNRTAVTPLLIVPKGQRIYWTIGSDPSMSTATAGE